jgi:hypothetical protein
MDHWQVAEIEGTWWLALYNEENGVEIRRHPIPFGNERDARRAMIRLNARYEVPK